MDNFSTGAAAPLWPCKTSRQRRAGPAPPLLQRRAPTCRTACRFTHVPRDDSRRSHVARPVERLDQGRTFCLTRQPEMRFLSNRYPKLTESTSFNGNDDRNHHSIRIATQHGRCNMAACRQSRKEARGAWQGNHTGRRARSRRLPFHDNPPERERRKRAFARARNRQPPPRKPRYQNGTACVEMRTPLGSRRAEGRKCTEMGRAPSAAASGTIVSHVKRNWQLARQRLRT